MNATEIENLRREAIADASSRIGDYLEKRVGKTDLAAMSEEEWLEFLATVVKEYRASVHKITEAPF